MNLIVLPSFCVCIHIMSLVFVFAVLIVVPRGKKVIVIISRKIALWDWGEFFV